jgi:hypothetical protein
MSRDNNNNSSCQYAVPDSCVEYTGSAGSQLGIKPGDRLSDLLDILIIKLESLTCDLDVAGELSNLTGGSISSCSSEVSTHEPLSYNISADTNSGLTVTYNLDNTISSLPANVSVQDILVVCSSSVNITTNFLRSNKSSGGFTVPLSHTPADLQFKLRLMTECGVVELYHSVTITPTLALGEWNTRMNVVDTTSTSMVEVSQSRYNELLANKLNTLEAIVNGKAVTSAPSTTNIDSLSNRLTILEDENVKLKSTIQSLGGTI